MSFGTEPIVAGAISAGETLTQFQPDLPDGAAFHLAVAYVLADRDADAVQLMEQLLDRNPGFVYGKVVLAAAYAEAGRQQDAERQTSEIRQRFPAFSSTEFGSLLRDASLRDKLAGALRKAGL